MSIFTRISTALGISTLGREVSRAIAELEAYSDRELADIGVTRSGIRQAVLYGRENVAVDRPIIARPVNDDRPAIAVSNAA
ncbi:DUF1127 domain-containing protein [Inquilinus sp. CAU 1745]|uniref:DUF1127 domain-containing protein n=1 Tax=Inquilinus sp. CAU 1745 TaxID=3140369 RepID=UPI00325BE0A7